MLSPTRLRMRVWERGAGLTLACGTGACATVVAAVLEGRAQRSCVVRHLTRSLDRPIEPIQANSKTDHYHLTPYPRADDRE